MASGLTDNHIDFAKYLAAFCLTIGLIGPYGTDQTTYKSIHHIDPGSWLTGIQ
jgi:hypothetical protein